MKRMNFPARRAIRKAQAENRQAIRDTLTPMGRWQLANHRPGSSKRERARLHPLVEAQVGRGPWMSDT